MSTLLTQLPDQRVTKLRDRHSHLTHPAASTHLELPLEAVPPLHTHKRHHTSDAQPSPDDLVRVCVMHAPTHPHRRGIPAVKLGNSPCFFSPIYPTMYSGSSVADSFQAAITVSSRSSKNAARSPRLQYFTAAVASTLVIPIAETHCKQKHTGMKPHEILR